MDHLSRRGFWMAGPNSSYTSCKLLAEKKRDPWIWGQRSKFRKFRSTTTVDPIPVWPVSRPGLSSTEWSKPRSPCCGSDPTVAVPCRSYTWPVPLGAIFSRCKRWWMLWFRCFCWCLEVSWWIFGCERDLQIKGSSSVTAWINWKWSILVGRKLLDFWKVSPKTFWDTPPFLYSHKEKSG